LRKLLDRVSAKPDELLDRRIAILNFSNRVYTRLHLEGISSIRDLLQRRAADLLRFRGFGKKSLHEVECKLAERNLKLGAACALE
jgi:DNA-directed RNA polymerase alpha subunit